MTPTVIDLSGADQTGVACLGCGAPTAMICDGCRQAAALHWWAGADRRAETADVSGGWCRLCHVGTAVWCAFCWPEAVTSTRAELGSPAMSRPCATCDGRGGIEPGRLRFRRQCPACAGSGRVPA